MAFYVNKKSEIILYGAGSRCYQCYTYLLSNFFNVLCVIDREPDKVSDKYKCPVIALNDMEWSQHKEAVVIICLQNGLLHDNIAFDFFKHGMTKIVFLPTSVKYLHDDVMRNYYQKLMENNWDIEGPIPEYNEIVLCEEHKNIIQDDGNMLTVWISLEYIFSYNPCLKDDDRWYNRHISQLKPYITLFEYIQGGKEYPVEYLQNFRKNNEDAQYSLLLDRVSLWNTYEEKLNTSSNYFSSAPLSVEWEHTHFKILDGHHRAIYLFLKGWYYLPLRVTRKDYTKFLCYKEQQEWEKLSKEIKIVLLKLCINIYDQMLKTKSIIYEIYEQEETGGYITWWFEHNGKGDISYESKRFQKVLLYVCLKEEALISRANVSEQCWIVTTPKIASKYDFKLYEELYIGFIEDRHEIIGLYKS